MTKILTRQEYHKIKGEKIYGKDNCPFCDLDSNKDKIIYRGKYWFVLHNISPYCGNERHIMAIPYEHINYSCELKKEHFEELSEIHKFVKEFFKDQEYFSFTRETMSNRSVEHLHMHFLVGKLQGKFLRKMLELQGYPIKQDLEF